MASAGKKGATPVSGGTWVDVHCVYCAVQGRTDLLLFELRRLLGSVAVLAHRIDRTHQQLLCLVNATASVALPGQRNSQRCSAWSTQHPALLCLVNATPSVALPGQRNSQRCSAWSTQQPALLCLVNATASVALPGQRNTQRCSAWSTQHPALHAGSACNTALLQDCNTRHMRRTSADQ
jgi:hypothetical protein